MVNSGNANAFTGKTGRQATSLTASIAAKAVGCSPSEIFLASTGVIGEPLDATKFDGVLGTSPSRPRLSDWMDAARAIMTTDTFPKVATATVKLGKAKVTINGMAKGAGMIAPDMATMLSFIFTDAPITAGALQSLLKAASRTPSTPSPSTATPRHRIHCWRSPPAQPRPRRAKNQPRRRPAPEGFHQGLACSARRSRRAGGARRRRRAQAGRDHRRGRDIEGFGAENRDVVANSPLVKTAIAGEDANWGRVVMAVGKAGEPANRDKLSISFNGIRVAKSGARDPSYTRRKSRPR